MDVLSSAPAGSRAGEHADGRDALRPLTSLRFAAALLVFIYHAAPPAAGAANYALGHTGVGFFFLLSGFILAYTYHGSFEGTVRAERVRAFYAARFARVYPLTLLATALALAVLARFGGDVWNASDAGTRGLALLAQVLLVQSWIPFESIYLGVNSPAWSISTEAFFYAFFPWVICALLRVFGHRPARIVYVAAALPWLLQGAMVLVPHPVDVWSSYVAPPIRVVDFLVGMLLGIAFLRGGAPAEERAAATVRELTAIAGVVAIVLVSPRFPAALRYSLLVMPFWAVLIAVFARQRGAVSALLSHPVAVRLGEISFAFYLVHWTVLGAVAAIGGPAHPAASALAAFTITLGASFALFHLVEQPLRVRIRSALAGRRSLEPVAAPS